MRLKITLVFFLLVSTLLGVACSSGEGGNNENPVNQTPIELKGSFPSADSNVEPGFMMVTFDFNQKILLQDKSKVMVNNQPASSVAAVDYQVRISMNAAWGESYTVSLTPGAIRSQDGYISTEEYSLTFNCGGEGKLNLTNEAINLMSYLKDVTAKGQILSGTMANVNLNTNEAYWVYTKTQHYPAINCIDYLHVYASGTWIDYSRIQEMEDWWNNNGIVAAMWHWNIKTNDGSDYTVRPGTAPGQTTFDVKKVNDPSSPEYQQMIQDIDKVADCLLLFKQKNIPIIWRPLHEAGGGWFWWDLDAQAYKKLWQLMYERFQEKGLNNLIWVWTMAVPYNKTLEFGKSWYPGDDFVDVVSYDIYDKPDAAGCKEVYDFLKNSWPEKLVALSECGSVAGISEQLDAGANWTWFMPWYDYRRTNDLSSDAFSNDDHQNANADWWRAAYKDDRVIFRDEVPSLK